MKKLIIPIILCLLCIIIFILVYSIKKTGFEFGFSGTTFYTSYTKSSGDCNTINTYTDGTKPTKSTQYNDGVCNNTGYYINNNKVTINIGDIACGNKIKIEEMDIKKGMNVYIKAKETQGLVTEQCLCSASLIITFSKKVNNVTLVNEDGTILQECY